jgi:hypothetical protein
MHRVFKWLGRPLCWVSAHNGVRQQPSPYPDAKARTVLGMIDAAEAYEGEPADAAT